MTSKRLASVCAACAAAGIAVLCTAGVIAYAAGNPYETYRTALVNTATAGNMTVNANFSIKKDGLTVADGNALYQQNESAKYSDVNAVISGQQIKRQEYSDQNIKIKSDGSSYSQKSRK